MQLPPTKLFFFFSFCLSLSPSLYLPPTYIRRYYMSIYNQRSSSPFLSLSLSLSLSPALRATRTRASPDTLQARGQKNSSCSSSNPGFIFFTFFAPAVAATTASSPLQLSISVSLSIYISLRSFFFSSTSAIFSSLGLPSIFACFSPVDSAIYWKQQQQQQQQDKEKNRPAVDSFPARTVAHAHTRTYTRT